MDEPGMYFEEEGRGGDRKRYYACFYNSEVSVRDEITAAEFAQAREEADRLNISREFCERSLVERFQAFLRERFRVELARYRAGALGFGFVA